jgi:hypothetical protein
MTGTKVVSIRLNTDIYFRYEMRAASMSKRVSTYLSSILEDADGQRKNNGQSLLVEQIDELKSMLETATDMISRLQDDLANGVQSGESNAALQALLMLRIMARPEHIELFNSQVKQLKLKTISFSK